MTACTMSPSMPLRSRPSKAPDASTQGSLGQRNERAGNERQLLERPGHWEIAGCTRNWGTSPLIHEHQKTTPAMMRMRQSWQLLHFETSGHREEIDLCRKRRITRMSAKLGQHSCLLRPALPSWNQIRGRN